MIRFERVGRALLVGMGLFGLAFCGGKASDPGSSESHFLIQCDADCAAGYECVCGVCTQPCSSDTSCRTLSAQATCMQAAAPLGCAIDSSVGAVCDAACAADQDCAALGANLTCQAGVCRPPLSCAELTQRASFAVNQAIANSDLSCASDQDCIAAPINADCADTCGVAVIAAAASAGLQPQIASVNLNLCGKFTSDGCPQAFVDCIGQTPACVNRQCVVAELVTQDASLSSCVAALDAPGTSCGGNGCVASDLCCSVSCDSSSDNSVSSCSGVTTKTTCAAAAPNATFVGTTPVGAVSLSYAWSGFEQGLSNALYLLFTAASPAATCDPVRLGLKLLSADGLPASYLGVHWLPVLLTTTSGSHVGVGRLELLSLGSDQRTPNGTLSVSGSDWDLQVSFSAPECPSFSGTND